MSARSKTLGSLCFALIAGCATGGTSVEGTTEGNTSAGGASAAPDAGGAVAAAPEEQSLAVTETLRGTLAPAPLSAQASPDSKDKLRVARPIVRPALRPTHIRPLVRGRMPVLRACLTAPESAPTDYPTGRYRLDFVIASDGTVSSAVLGAQPEGVPEEVTRCLLSEVRSWRFAAMEDGTVTMVRYPLVVRAER